MVVSMRKLPQKTPAIILQEKKDLSSNEVGEAQKTMNIVKERDMDLKQKRAHNVLPSYPLFDSDLPAHANELQLLSIVLQSLYLEVWDVVSSNNANVYVPLERMIAPMHCSTRTTHSSLELSAPPLAFAGSSSSTDTT